MGVLKKIDYCNDMLVILLRILQPGCNMSESWETEKNLCKYDIEENIQTDTQEHFAILNKLG